MPTLKKLLVVEIVISHYRNQRLEGDGSFAPISVDESGETLILKCISMIANFVRESLKAMLQSKNTVATNAIFVTDFGGRKMQRK